MIELLLFLFTDFDNRMGNFYTVKHKFHTYQECNDYIKEHTIEENIYTPTGQAIGLTYCKPVDTDK
jgi:hypothetical protein